MNKNKLILKITVLLLGIMLIITLWGLISSNTSAAKSKMEKKSVLIYEENDAIYGSFMTEIYPIIIGKTVDFNTLPPDSIQIYLKKVLNLYPNISPIKTTDSVVISSKFGKRISPVTKRYEFHQGVDIRSRIGTRINSTMAGEVEKIYVQDTARRYSNGYGNCIIIKNSLGFETLYGHLRRMYVKKGQQVEKGQFIATVGITGNATGPNLHYEIHQGGDLRDPLSPLFMRYKKNLTVTYEYDKYNIENISNTVFNNSNLKY